MMYLVMLCSVLCMLLSRIFFTGCVVPRANPYCVICCDIMPINLSQHLAMGVDLSLDRHLAKDTFDFSGMTLLCSHAMIETLLTSFYPFLSLLSLLLYEKLSVFL